MNAITNQEHLAAIFVKENEKVNFIGSCFFFNYSEQVLVCTAEHVIRGWTGVFVVVAKSEEYLVEPVYSNQDFDVAFLKPKKIPKNITLTFSSDRQVPGNLSLLAYEYSTTEFKDGIFHTVPATRLGNCVRVIQLTDVFGKAGQDMLELSFPALRGASGAAVVHIHNGKMIAHGMIVANTERHLIPAHIETILDQNNEILEEKKYFLPQAVAVNSIYIIHCFESYLKINKLT